jgi:hypothetical protein
VSSSASDVLSLAITAEFLECVAEAIGGPPAAPPMEEVADAGVDTMRFFVPGFSRFHGYFDCPHCPHPRIAVIVGLGGKCLR